MTTDTQCGAKHLTVIGIVVGAVLLVCSSLWAWTGSQLSNLATRLNAAERDLSSVQSEIRVQYTTLRSDVSEIKADVRAIRDRAGSKVAANQ